MPSIEVDFNNCDREGKVRLNTGGAIRSLNASQVTLRNGLEVELTSGDFFPIKRIVEQIPLNEFFNIHSPLHSIEIPPSLTG